MWDKSRPATVDEMKSAGITLTRELYDRIDRRSVDAPEKVPAYLGRDTSWWYDEGIDHKVVDGNIQRTFPSGDQGWFFEVENLASLVKLQETFGQLVIQRDWGVNVIEIYDDYRE